MLEGFLAWGTIGVLIPLLIGVGIAVVNTRDSDDFSIAKFCFVLAGLIGAAKIVQLGLNGSWNTFPVYAAAFAVCLWFCLEASRYVDRKRQNKLAQEVRVDRDAFIIRQLEQFIAEERQIDRRASRSSIVETLAGFGERIDFRDKVEHFLALHLSGEHVARFQKRNVYALQEMIKELLDERPQAPRQLSAPVIKTREDIINDLVLFRDEGSALLAKAVDGHVSGLSKRVAEWENKVGDYLAAYCDVADKAEFLLNSGMERYVSTIDYSKVERRFRPNPEFLDRIHTRLLRLKRIIERITKAREKTSIS